MLMSMTGCGSAALSVENHQIEVEVHSLNSKFFDCSLRLVGTLNAKELILRKLLAETFLRGKVSLNVQCVPIKGAERRSSELDTALFRRHWHLITEALSAVQAKASPDAMLAAVVRAPVYLQADQVPHISAEKLWAVVQKALKVAIKDCQTMQITEGEKIQALILQEMTHIEQGLAEVLRMEPDRNKSVKKKVQSRAQDALGSHYAEGRMLQELFFYIERMDFTEEKDRLAQHILFFKDLLQEEKISEAKRLLFIVQEIGRELNTLGTKSHHAGIQRQIVDMKSALEKIKEQLQNIK